MKKEELVKKPEGWEEWTNEARRYYLKGVRSVLHTPTPQKPVGEEHIHKHYDWGKCVCGKPCDRGAMDNLETEEPSEPTVSEDWAVEFDTKFDKEYPSVRSYTAGHLQEWVKDFIRSLLQTTIKAERENAKEIFKTMNQEVIFGRQALIAELVDKVKYEFNGYGGKLGFTQQDFINLLTQRK